LEREWSWQRSSNRSVSARDVDSPCADVYCRRPRLWRTPCEGCHRSVLRDLLLPRHSDSICLSAHRCIERALLGDDGLRIGDRERDLAGDGGFLRGERERECGRCRTPHFASQASDAILSASRTRSACLCRPALRSLSTYRAAYRRLCSSAGHWRAFSSWSRSLCRSCSYRRC
jgi:hypothetical protein